MNNNDIIYNKSILDELLKKPLIKQRSPEWFKLREDRLTASDLHDAIKNPTSLAKKKLKGITFISSAIPALKWGTMFEAMAIRIYSNMKDIKIHEFGLIINDDIENFGASPDGITEEGVMIEIKCPYSRKIIDGNIPEKYYYQMQGQLAVCKLNKCDYIECEFVTYEEEDEYLSEIKDIDNNYKHGIIAQKKEGKEYIYHYSKENQNGEENINEMNKYEEEGFSFNYWKLKTINIQEVNFDKENWDNVITNKIKTYTEIYFKEKELQNPANLFIDEDC
jgi:putative phage-type endonuclease